MNDYEKLGAFYLGRDYDLATRKLKDRLVLYDSKDLTTHGVILFLNLNYTASSLKKRLR
jgi:hypothetical protein